MQANIIHLTNTNITNYLQINKLTKDPDRLKIICQTISKHIDSNNHILIIGQYIDNLEKIKNFLNNDSKIILSTETTKKINNKIILTTLAGINVLNLGIFGMIVMVTPFGNIDKIIKYMDCRKCFVLDFFDDSNCFRRIQYLHYNFYNKHNFVVNEISYDGKELYDFYKFSNTYIAKDIYVI